MSIKALQLSTALKNRGLIVARVWWEPVGSAMEMCGHSGGWLAEIATYGVEPLGYNFKDALNHAMTAPWLENKND